MIGNKAQRKRLRSLLQGKVCVYCGRALSTHMVEDGVNKPCDKARHVMSRIQREVNQTSGSTWLRIIKEIGKPSEKSS